MATDAVIGTHTSLFDPELLANRCFLYHLIGRGTGEWLVPIGGIEMPELVGLSVVAGDPVDLAALRGDAGTTTGSDARKRLPVPVASETC